MEKSDNKNSHYNPQTKEICHICCNFSLWLKMDVFHFTRYPFPHLIVHSSSKSYISNHTYKNRNSIFFCTLSFCPNQFLLSWCLLCCCSYGGCGGPLPAQAVLPSVAVTWQDTRALLCAVTLSSAFTAGRLRTLALNLSSSLTGCFSCKGKHGRRFTV